jgi:Ca2+-binding EF-hand superfamily protein
MKLKVMLMAAGLCLAGCVLVHAEDVEKAPKEKKPKPTPEERFAKMDTDSDGFISLDEFSCKAKTDEAKAKCKTKFDACDQDGDGKLSMTELNHKPEKAPKEAKEPKVKKEKKEKKDKAAAPADEF